MAAWALGLLSMRCRQQAGQSIQLTSTFLPADCGYARVASRHDLSQNRADLPKRSLRRTCGSAHTDKVDRMGCWNTVDRAMRGQQMDTVSVTARLTSILCRRPLTPQTPPISKARPIVRSRRPIRSSFSCCLSLNSA
jgi:hypothetical protein